MDSNIKKLKRISKFSKFEENQMTAMRLYLILILSDDVFSFFFFYLAILIKVLINISKLRNLNF